jgi:hypothetical protein
MSWPQSKVSQISDDPRPLRDCTLRTPGMPRSASSTGRVTSIAMRSAGRAPASRLTRRRGKFTSGNSDTGSVCIAKMPHTTIAANRKRIERA